MKYKCDLCGEEIADDLKQYVEHTEQHIVNIIKQKHPGWVEDTGMCPKCLEYFKKQMKGKP